MKIIISFIVGFLIGYNFITIFRKITTTILKLKFKERKYKEKMKIDNDLDFWDISDFK